MNCLIICFNPCSYGSSVLTIDRDSRQSIVARPFQSLFLWIFRSYDLRLEIQFFSVVFVSILVLMDLPFLQRLSMKYMAEKALVSILVLMDLPFLRYQVSYECECMNMFQSLFLWIFRSYLSERKRYTVDPNVSILVLMDLPFLHTKQYLRFSYKWSFNPCSYGSSVLT